MPTLDAPAISEGANGQLVFHDGSPCPRPIAGAVISLTRRCNESCPICIESEEDRTATRELAAEPARALARFFGGRVPTVMSCSGEALLYPGFPEFAREVATRGSTLAIGTNGLVFAREAILRQALEAGLRDVLVSCHALAPDDFDVLTGTRGRLPTFRRALANLAAAMVEVPDLVVTLELVITKRIVGKLAAYLDEVRALFPVRRPRLRVETMRWINRAVRAPELRPDLRDVAGVVAAVLEHARPDFEAQFSFVPLCLLPGAEHLANEPSRILHRDAWVGNRSLDALEIVEWCRLGNALLADPRHAAVCAACTLKHFCPGAFDVPVPPDLAWPVPSALAQDLFLDRLHAPADGRDARLALVARDRDPALNRELRPDRAAGSRALCACAGEPGPDDATPPTAAVPPAARQALARALQRVGRRFPGLRIDTGGAEVAIWLPGTVGPGADLTLFHEAAGDPRFYKAAGPFRLRYTGNRTARLEAVIDALVAELASR